MPTGVLRFQVFGLFVMRNLALRLSTFANPSSSKPLRAGKGRLYALAPDFFSISSAFGKKQGPCALSYVQPQEFFAKASELPGQALLIVERAAQGVPHSDGIELPVASSIHPFRSGTCSSEKYTRFV